MPRLPSLSLVQHRLHSSNTAQLPLAILRVLQEQPVQTPPADTVSAHKIACCARIHRVREGVLGTLL